MHLISIDAKSVDFENEEKSIQTAQSIDSKASDGNNLNDLNDEDIDDQRAGGRGGSGGRRRGNASKVFNKNFIAILIPIVFINIIIKF